MNTKLKKSTVEDLVSANKNMLKLKENGAFVFYPNIYDVGHWRLIAMSDASFANMDDG